MPTVTSGRKTLRETAGADIFNIAFGATSVTIVGRMKAGDIINVEGLASEFTASALGRNITLKSDTQTIKFQLDSSAGSTSVRFLDGDLTATFVAKVGATLGGQKLLRRFVGIDDTKLGDIDSSAVVYTDDGASDSTGASGGAGTGGGTTPPTVPGPTVALTTNKDNLAGTDKSDSFNAMISNADLTKTTLEDADTIVDTVVTDSDVFNLSTDGDVKLKPTIKGIETINVKLNAATSRGAAGAAKSTDLDFVADNIASDTKITFDNLATITAVNGVSITGDKGGQREFSDKFSSVTSDLASTAGTFHLKAIGTIGTPASLKLGAAATEVTVIAAGHLKYDAATADGLLNITAAKSVDVSSTKAAAAMIKAGGDVTITDLSAASIVNITTTDGKIISSAGKLTAATNVKLTATKDVTIETAAVTDLTIATKGTATITETAAKLVTVNASGNGDKLTLDLSGLHATSVLSTLNTSGMNDITVTLDPSKSSKLTTITKGNEGALGIKLTTKEGDIDLSTAALDSVELAVDNKGKKLTVASGQTIVVSKNQSAATEILAPKSTAKTNTIFLKLDDDTRTSTAVDLTSIKFGHLRKVTIDASVDRTSGGAAQASTFTKIELSNGNSSTDLDLITGINGATIGTITLSGANKLTITGSGDIKGASDVITASEVDASIVSGTVSLDLASDKLSILKSGTGKDIISISNASRDFTVNTGAGDDSIEIKDTASNRGTYVINGGEGNDTLILKTDMELGAAAGKVVTISNIENLTYDTTTTGIKAIDSNLLTGKAYSLRDVSTNKSGTIAVTVASADTSVDLSTLTVASANKSSVADDIFRVNAGNSTKLTSFKGANVARNEFIGGEVTVDAIGGQYEDKFVIGSGMGAFTGGKGKDEFDVSKAVEPSASKFVIIRDFEVNAGVTVAAVDSLKGTGTKNIVTTTSQYTTTTGWSATNGVMKKTDATLADFVTIAAAQAKETASAFVYAGDLYIYSTGTKDADATDDVMVDLIGLGQTNIGIEATVKTAGFVLVT